MSSITLRPLVSSDAEAFMAWGGDPEVTQSLFWDHYKDVDSARKFIQDVAEKHPWFMAICLDGVPVGAITLEKGKNRASMRAELGYVIAKSYWNKGITSKAIKLAIQRGFRDLDIQRIEAYADPENKGSVRVLEKNGFSFEGTLKKYVIHRGKIRDRVLYALTI
jgi:[ribosomal protein S5]-alanine N-acetyltransferase